MNDLVPKRPAKLFAQASVLLLGGEPIDEPVAGHGPCVMSSQADIAQATQDLHGGRFGRMAP